MVDLTAIVSGVRSRDYTMQDQARAAGAAAVPELARLLGDADEVVRELAVHCLVATAAPAATPALLLALRDADPQVAMAAAHALHTRAAPAQVPDLLAAYDAAGEPLLQREIALVLGRLPVAAAALHERRRAATDPLVIEGLDAALARIGERDAQAAVGQAARLSAADSRLRWFELAEYIGQRWLLPVLAELLADETDLLRVATDGRAEGVQALRSCDIALVLIAQIGHAVFAFPVTRGQNFEPAQIDEARRFALAARP